MTKETEEALLRSRELRSRLVSQLLPNSLDALASADGREKLQRSFDKETRTNRSLHSTSSSSLTSFNEPGNVNGQFARGKHAPIRHSSSYANHGQAVPVVTRRNSSACHATRGSRSERLHTRQPPFINHPPRGFKTTHKHHTIPHTQSLPHQEDNHGYSNHSQIRKTRASSVRLASVGEVDVLERRRKDIDFAFVWIKHELCSMQVQSQQIILDMVAVLKSIREVGNNYRHEQHKQQLLSETEEDSLASVDDAV